jgi:hypothetical protein
VEQLRKCRTLGWTAFVYGFLLTLLLMLSFSVSAIYSYACVRSFPDTFGHQKDFIVATMVIVLVTVFALGTTTEFMLNYLGIEVNVDEDKYMDDWHRERRSSSLILRFEEYVQRHVLRDSEQTSPRHGSSKILQDEDDNMSKLSAATPDGFNYGAQVEMTESNHLEYIRQRGRRESLFDYGGNN